MNTTPDIERLRFNMIEQQIRPWDVLDLEILDLLGEPFDRRAHAGRRPVVEPPQSRTVVPNVH